ncbi:shieldin complex subunit 2 isoform X2 [Sceloporus undulatus]|uniref:shieldin complex subunit 2 isoform X2 n=1 Tax=Sceloporus undulatus TaxID=8520 RepID=UPI001C4D4839|nr:shieldin complex subunit 2 isoform X2 [Sceloporus undulatus]
MSKAPQIHIFFGAPILPTLLKKPKEDTYLIATTEPWKKLYFSFAKDTFTLCMRKSKCPDHTCHQMPNSEALSVCSKDQLTTSFRKKCATDAESVKSVSNENKISESTGNICHVSGNISTENQMNHLAYEQLLNPVKTDEEQSKQSEDNEGAASYMIRNHFDFSPLVPSTSNVSKNVKSIEQDENPPAFQCDHCQPQGHYLTIHSPQIMNKSKIEKPLHVCASLGVSTDTEYLSILTSSQIAFLSGRHAAEQNKIQSKSAKDKEMKLYKPCKDNEIVSDPLIQLNENGNVYVDVAKINCTQTYESSPELFDSNSPVKENSIVKETSLQETGGMPTQHLHSPDNKCNNDFCHTEPPKIGTLCSKGDWSAKRPRAFEDILPTTNFRGDDQRQSKKAKSDDSPICPVVPVKEQVILGYKKAQKYPSLLNKCLCKGQKYTVLVTVLHPCHIKEIQIKSGNKLPSHVPLATVVVFDQSEVQRKVMLWRGAAFWSLTLFPGDIILLTDVIVYENCWSEETMLQSTFTSQLLNLGSCSTVNQNEFSYVVNVNILQDLLAYVSSKHPYLEALPQRKTQTLNNVQHALLHQLEPDILVHAVMKIVNLTVLTESTYSFKGERKRKIILTVEQVKDQNKTLVLWGASTAFYPQLQRKRGLVAWGMHRDAH